MDNIINKSPRTSKALWTELTSAMDDVDVNLYDLAMRNKAELNDNVQIKDEQGLDEKGLLSDEIARKLPEMKRVLQEALQCVAILETALGVSPVQKDEKAKA